MVGAEAGWHEIIHQCLLTHGHGGYGGDYDFGQRYRDVMGLQIGDGTANIMKMIIAPGRPRSSGSDQSRAPPRVALQTAQENG